MLDLASEDSSRDVTAGPDVRLLSAETLLLVWDLPTRVWTTPALEAVDGKPVAPLASLRLALEDGGTRILWALRRPRNETLTLATQAGALGARTELTIEPDARFDLVEARHLLDNAIPSARLSLASTLLGSWPTIFGLRRSRSFSRTVYELAANLVPAPGPAKALARLDEQRALVGTVVADSVKRGDAVYVAAPGAFRRVSMPPYLGPVGRDGRRLLCLAVEQAWIGTGAFLIAVGAKGVAVRRIAATGRMPSLVRWWRAERDRDATLREYIIAALAHGTQAGRSAALDFQMRCPLPPRKVSGGGGLPTAEIDLAISSGAGLLVGGWFSDPNAMIEALEYVDGEGTPQPLSDTWHRFAGRVSGDGGARQATGFCAFTDAVGAPVPMLQPRFVLRQASGARYLMVPPPQPTDPGEARARVLRAIPPQHLDQDVIARLLAPTLADLQRRLRDGLGAPTVRHIGTPVDTPAASIVVPLYRVLDFLRVQVATLASDPDIAGTTEIIYVLDSPEQAAEVDHLLRGLHLLYGLPMTLVVMPRNAGYAIACNAGAAVARGNVLALVNSDVIPAAPGWLETLTRRLEADDGISAVGPKLLFEDQSVQHAGMYFARDHRGRWLNHHFHKGMPRDFVALNVERRVPAVTGACLVVKRAVFEAVGGFTEDYVIGDYEDSDLCLKIRAAGHDIAYVPAAELYHLERRSISTHTDYMRGTASEYNAWLHAQRWGDTMAELMSGRGHTAWEVAA